MRIKACALLWIRYFCKCLNRSQPTEQSMLFSITSSWKHLGCKWNPIGRQDGIKMLRALNWKCAKTAQASIGLAFGFAYLYVNLHYLYLYPNWYRLLSMSSPYGYMSSIRTVKAVQRIKPLAPKDTHRTLPCSKSYMHWLGHIHSHLIAT